MADPEIRKKAWQARLASPAWTAKPNAGHRALVTLEERGRLAAIVTQNTDGLHQVAGNRAGHVIEIHGTVRDVRCMSCEYRVPMEVVARRLDAGEADPACPACEES